MRAGELARGVGQVLVAWPRFVAAPLYRRWHLRWGATNEVWPWLVQLQQIQVGDRVPMSGTVNETTAFNINGFEPHRRVECWTNRRTPQDLEGAFVTYGLDVSLSKLRDPAAARAHVPVTPAGRTR